MENPVLGVSTEMFDTGGGLGHRYSVLIAEDEAGIREAIAQIIETRLGCSMMCAVDGDAALREVEAHNPDVLITDMVMPGLHGLELVRAVHEKSPRTSIIAMTGYPEDFPYVEVVQAGADDFIRKPFPAAELEAKLIRLFRERDISRAQRVAEVKYRSLFELSMDGMLLANAASHEILDANHSFRELSERASPTLIGQRLFEMFNDVDRIRMEQWLGICSHSGRGALADLTLLNPGGRKVHVDVTSTFIDLEFERIIFLSFKDVTEKVLIEHQLADAAQKDALTGLLNKRSFQNRLEAAIARARERSVPLALMFIDLDNFKACNDTHGHQAGDRLLTSMGEVISKSVRATSDDGFRLGGDEFAVILMGADRENSKYVAERMREEFQRIENFNTSMSIGVAQFDESLKAETFVRGADEALYKAKNAGKNTVHIN